MSDLRMAKTYHDFCPLCGSRFHGNSPDEVYAQIIKHVEDKTCENNFKPLEQALADTGKDLIDK
jgi:hypothetical protein